MQTVEYTGFMFLFYVQTLILMLFLWKISSFDVILSKVRYQHLLNTGRLSSVEIWRETEQIFDAINNVKWGTKMTIYLLMTM